MQELDSAREVSRATEPGNDNRNEIEGEEVKENNERGRKTRKREIRKG